MPNTNPNPQLISNVAYSQASVSVPSTASYPVSFWADENGNAVLAVVSPGNSAIVNAQAGFFFAVSPQGQSTFTWSPVLPMQAYSPVAGSNYLSNSTLGNNTMYMAPFDIPDALQVSDVNFFASIATVITASNQTGSGALQLNAAIYQKGTGTATDQLSQIWSSSAGVTFSCSSNSNYSFTSPLGTTTLASSNASNYMKNSIGGYRQFALPFVTTLAPGRYFMAVNFSGTNADGSNSIGASIGQVTNANQINYQPWGDTSAASNVGTPAFQEMLGTYSATTTAFPATLPVTSSPIIGMPTATIPYFNFSAFATNLSEG